MSYSFNKKPISAHQLTINIKEDLFRYVDWNEINGVKHVLDRTGNVNCLTSINNTALMHACHNKFISLINLLLERGADPNF